MEKLILVQDERDITSTYVDCNSYHNPQNHFLMEHSSYWFKWKRKLEIGYLFIDLKYKKFTRLYYTYRDSE